MLNKKVVTCGCVAAILLLSTPAARADEYWTVSSGDWSVPGYWDGGAVPTSSDNAYIVNGGTATVTTAGNVCSGLSLGSTAGSGAVKMTGGSLAPSDAYVGNSGTGRFTQSGGTNSISNGLYLGWDSAGTYSLSGAGQLQAVDEWLACGTGTTALFQQSGGTNTVTGWFVLGEGPGSPYGGNATYNLSGGELLMPDSRGWIGVCGTGTFTQSGGTNAALGGLMIGVNSGSSGTYNLNGGTLAACYYVQGNGTFNFNGGLLQAGGPSVTMNDLSYAYVMSGGAKIDTNGQTITIALPLLDGGGGGGLTKLGAGTLTLSDTCSYTGPTAVNAGSLIVAGSLGSTAVTVSGGATLGGTGSIGGTVVVAGGSTADTQGAVNLADGMIGTLTLSDSRAADTVLTLGGPTAGNLSVLTFEVGAIADRIQVAAGKVAVNPGGSLINIIALSGFGPGTYDLLDFPSGQASGLGYLSLATTSLSGYTLSLQSTPTSEQLVVSVPEPGTLALVAAGLACGAAIGLRRGRNRAKGWAAE